VYLLVTPYWFIVLLLGIWPARRVVRSMKRTRRHVDRRAFPVFVSPRPEGERFSSPSA